MVDLKSSHWHRWKEQLPPSPRSLRQGKVGGRESAIVAQYGNDVLQRKRKLAVAVSLRGLC